MTIGKCKYYKKKVQWRKEKSKIRFHLKKSLFILLIYNLRIIQCISLQETEVSFLFSKRENHYKKWCILFANRVRYNEQTFSIFVLLLLLWLCQLTNFAILTTNVLNVIMNWQRQNPAANISPAMTVYYLVD